MADSYFNGSRKRRSYCKYRNKFGQLGIRNRIEYVIFYLFLVNIIDNCHEIKYVWIYCDAQDDLFEWKAPQKINKIKKHDVPDLYRSLHRICFYLEFCLQLCVDHKNVVVPEALQQSSTGQT